MKNVFFILVAVIVMATLGACGEKKEDLALKDAQIKKLSEDLKAEVAKVEELDKKVVGLLNRESDLEKVLKEKDQQIADLKARPATPVAAAPTAPPSTENNDGRQWPYVFQGMALDENSDGIDDRYDRRKSQNGEESISKWVFKKHPWVGEIAFPIDSRGGIYHGGNIPLVEKVPFEGGGSWIHVPLGDPGQNGEFQHFPGLRLVDRASGTPIQLAWVVTRDSSKIPTDSLLRPQKVEVSQVRRAIPVD